MVLTDDNFASIVNAVEEGRTIYDNIRKFVQYLLATNAGEVLLMLFATLAGWPFPLFPIQILWINLVTDAFPALGSGGAGGARCDEASAPTARRAAAHRARGLRILFYGVLNAAVTAVAFAVVHGGRDENLPAARTAAFATLAFAQLLFSSAAAASGTRWERSASSPTRGSCAGSRSPPGAGRGVEVPALRPFFKVVPVPFTWSGRWSPGSRSLPSWSWRPARSSGRGSSGARSGDRRMNYIHREQRAQRAQRPSPSVLSVLFVLSVM